MNLNSLRKPFRYTFLNSVLIIIGINLLSYCIFTFTAVDSRIFGLSVAGFIYKKFIWQPITYMFVHAGFQHLFFNMLGLLFFGLAVEKAIGTKEFLLMYFLIGICSGIFSVLVYYAYGLYIMQLGIYPTIYMVNLVGASGAIYGILFSYAVFFPRNRIFIWGLIPVPAPILIIVYAVIEFFSQFSGSNVAHMTHLAGFAFAFLYVFIRMGINPIKIWFK